MLLADTVLLAALAIFVAAWWWRALPRRGLILPTAATIALLAAVAGLAMNRWQAAAGLAVAASFLTASAVTRWRRKPASRGLRVATGTIAALMALGAGIPLWLFPVADLPAPDGPDKVGVRTFELVDPSRPGVLGAPPNAPRRLLVRVWYPATRVEAYARRRYFSAVETRTIARGLGAMAGFPPFFTYLANARTWSYENAPLLPAAAPRPVVFYSHGYMSFLGQNTALMETLASHGYIVFSVQHAGDSAPTPFADGSVIPTDPAMAADSARPLSQADRDAMVGRTPDDRLNGLIGRRRAAAARDDRMAFHSVPTWIADRLFVHDRLQQGRVPPAIAAIAAAGDLGHVGEIGMSFGGAINGALCLIDRRCAAGVNLDGWDAPQRALDTDMPVPFLMFHSDLAAFGREAGAPEGQAPRSFNELSYERFATAGTRPDIVRLSLLRTRHLGLSDLSWFIRRPLRDPLLGAAPAATMIGAQNDFVLAFLDRHLRHRANAFPARQFATWQGSVVRLDNGYIRTWWLQKPAAERARLEAEIAEARALAPTRP